MKRVTIADFQRYGNIFSSIRENHILRQELSEYGYDDQEINKGRMLYDTASRMIEHNKTETTEEKMAYEAFSKKFDELKKNYATDRKKAKIVFKEQEAVLSALKVKGVASVRISSLLDDIDTFYKQLQINPALLMPIKRLKVGETHISAQLNLLSDTQKAYENYTKEKGESQQATKDKDDALVALEKWVREFYSVAKIALEDKPQLMEALGKHIKS